jgi:hypothetical protein
VRRLTAPGVDRDDLQRIENFSLMSYVPMNRLLNKADIEFLRSQPGYEPGLDQKLRAERRAVFRTYLRSLTRDFNALHKATRTFVADSPVDQPELTRQIVRTSFRFWYGVSLVHYRLLLDAVNLEPTSVSVADLVNATGWMNQQLRELAASRSMA